MRHTIAVRGSSLIKNGELTYHLPNIQDGECVKLTQGDKHIYLTYRISESMSNKYAEVNQHLLSLNGLDSDGRTTVEQAMVRGVENLSVEVSQLDWKIVNLNQLKIAQSFLEQISVVWPNALIPIYYDDLNFVVLKIMCDKACRLNINTTVEFIQKNNKNQENEQKEDEQEQEPYQSQLILSAEDQKIKNGYLNRISVSTKVKEYLPDDYKFWIVQNMVDFNSSPSIGQLLQLEKIRQKKPKDEPQEQLSSKRLVLLQIDQNLNEGEYSCTKQCQQLLGLSEKIKIASLDQYKPNIQNLSFDMFLNDQQFSINIYKLQANTQEQILKTKIEHKFAQHIVNKLCTKKQFFFLQQLYPYCLENSIYIIALSHQKDKQIRNKMHRIVMIGKQSADKKQEYFKRLTSGRITFVGQSKGSLQATFLHEQYSLISKWIKVIQQNKSLEIAQESKENDKMTEKVFEIIYEDEIQKVMEFIGSSKFSQEVCAICSYGSNGKSYIHEYLKKYNHRMWKVNFRQLNSPSLSFKEIDFYLQWIFANSPYKALFFDDFDSLCAKIDEGDQLRKRQKTISKLLLRRINTYLDVYNIRLIITAKSDSTIDQQLAKHITVILKNPTRELRLKALTVLSEKFVVDSPIKRIQLQGEREYEYEKIISQRHLNEIVETTQSLTYGAFVKHAISLTKPKNIKTTHIFDFSKIAGLKTAKTTIKSIIEKPIKYSFLFKSVPIKLPRGILLYGATGNGKSAIGTAVQDQFKMKYFSVKGSDILSKYIGGSQAAVRDIFQKALSVSPSIIFFDQFQSIVPKRSSNNTGVNDRIVNQFLCYLDGVSAISGVYIVAASSRPDLIDPAVLRPGRLDAHLFLDYPQPQQREELIRMFQKSIKMEVKMEQIIQKTTDYSYSDLIGLFKELRIKRSAEVLKYEHYSSEDFIKISRQLLEQTLSNFKLSVNPKQQKRQKQLYLNFQNGVSPDIKAQKQIQY